MLLTEVLAIIDPSGFAGKISVASVIAPTSVDEGAIPKKKRKVPLPQGLKLRTEPFGVCTYFHL